MTEEKNNENIKLEHLLSQKIDEVYCHDLLAIISALKRKQIKRKKSINGKSSK